MVWLGGAPGKACVGATQVPDDGLAVQQRLEDSDAELPADVVVAAAGLASGQNDRWVGSEADASVVRLWSSCRGRVRGEAGDRHVEDSLALLVGAER